MLQKGLVGLIAPRRGATTLVWRGDGDEKAAFAQMQLEDGAQRARMYFFAPAGAETPSECSVALLEGLAKEAGACAARNLMAEAQEGSAEFVALRKAGFAIYARQQVYRLLARPAALKTDVSLQSCSPQHEIPIHRLYSNIVPALVRQVEPTPTGTHDGYVLLHEDDLVALLCVNRGPKGIWAQPYVHPEAEDAIGEVLAAFLLGEELDAHKPVYVCARSYQSWMRGALQDAGFRPFRPREQPIHLLPCINREAGLAQCSEFGAALLRLGHQIARCASARFLRQPFQKRHTALQWRFRARRGNKVHPRALRPILKLHLRECGLFVAITAPDERGRAPVRRK